MSSSRFPHPVQPIFSVPFARYLGCFASSLGGVLLGAGIAMATLEPPQLSSPRAAEPIAATDGGHERSTEADSAEFELLPPARPTAPPNPDPLVEPAAPATDDQPPNSRPRLTEPESSPDSDYMAPLPSPDRDAAPVLPPIERSPLPIPPRIPSGNSPTAPRQAPQLPNRQRTAPSFETYRLGPGDGIFVNVRRFPDLSFQATLDLQGNIILPLQGVISLNGLTLQESSELIQFIYDQYVVDPVVSLTLIAQRSVEVTLVGEVVRPGFYPLASPQITTALLSAGGVTGEADLRSVTIQRPLVNGEVLEETVDLFTPLKEGRQLPDISLQDGDIVIIHRLDPAVMDGYDRDLIARSTLAKPVITVRILNYGSGNLGSATVGRLGALDLPNGSRFADALVRANLNPDTSDLNGIALIRFDEESGQAVTTVLNGRDAFEGVPSANPPLQDNDVIVVNRTLLAKITYALNTFTQPFRDVLGFLLFFEQLSDSAESLFGP